MSSELAVVGADIANQQAGGNSLLDNAGMFTGSAVVSGLAGIYNTVVEGANYFGAEVEQIDVSRALETYDRDWYNYYKENKQLVDVAGFVGGSFIPGGLAIKGLKAAQAMKATGAIGRSVSGSLNFAASRRDAYLAKGLQEIASEGGSAYAYINANKWASMAWGFADNVIQAAAFESAVALTMNKSPVLADSSKTDLLSDIAFGAFVGGTFGGAIDAIVTNKMFKDSVKQIGLKQRDYDVLSNYGNLGLSIGDEAYGMVDSLFALPKSVRDSDKVLEVSNKLRKGQPLTTLDLEKHLKTTLTKTEREAFENVQLSLSKLGGSDNPEVGQAMSQMILDMVKSGIDTGASPAAVKQKVGDYLLGLRSVKTLKDDAPLDVKSSDELFYIADKVDLAKLEAGGNDIGTLLTLARSRTPFEKNATARPYQVIGDVGQAKVAAGVTRFQEAWEQGADIAVIGGKFRINPKSEIFKQVDDPKLIPQRYLNTRTGGVSEEVTPTWADMLEKGVVAEKAIMEDGVLNGKKFLKLADDIAPADAFTATARHAWASKIDVAKLVGKTIDSQDISRLERLVQSGAPLEGVKIKVGEDIIDAATVDLRSMLTDTKLSRAQDLLDAGVTDMRAIAYNLAVPENWIERAISNGFVRTTADDLSDASWRNLDEFLRKENFIAAWQSPRSLVELGAVEQETLELTEKAATTKGAKYVDTFVTGELGFRSRVADSELRRKNAFSAVFGGEESQRFVDVEAAELIKLAEETGAGAGLLNFANASYGEKLKLWSQTTGKLTHLLIEKTVNANLERIQPYLQRMLDDKSAAAELGVALTYLRRSPDTHYLLPGVNGKQQLVVRDVVSVDRATGQQFIDSSKLAKFEQETGRKALQEIESDLTADFLNTWKQVNGERVERRKVLMNSRGATLGWDSNAIYAPPINTQRYPFFAFVKVRDGRLGSTSDVGMITARNAEELNKLAREIPEQYEVFFKKDTEQYFKVKNEYDAQLSFNEPKVDSKLRREGKLGDFFYEVRPESVMEEFIQYSQAADAALVRHGVDTRYGQLITELNALGDQFTRVATSQATGASKLYDKASVNPFGDYVRTALDLSKRSSFPLVHQLNEFVDSIGTRAYQILVANTEKARAGTVSWQEAEAIATKYGIGGVYNEDNVATAFAVANRPADRNLIKETVSKVNMTLATVGLRLDFANSLVNIVSLPMMLGTELASLKGLAKSDPKLLGALNELMTINPTGTVAVPSTTKMIGNAIKNMFGEEGAKRISEYRTSGDVKNVVAQFHEMMNDVAILPTLAPKAWSKNVDAAVEKMSKFTGNNFSEDFTRFISADVMRQMTDPLVEAGKLSRAEAGAYISTFVNRVNGNYIASQRPIIFQGTVGSAVSLFQTYMFNVMQQLTRHIEDRNTRSLITMGGLQGGLYGLNGLPFFDAVNTHLIGNAAINDGHRDIYSTTTQLAGKQMGDWLLYGTVSGFPLFGDKSPALYTRGDLNPRHVTVLPVSPRDIPAVDVSIKVASNLADVGRKLVSGADISSSLLEGLEHNGVSRPLAGFAQLAQGYATTGKGSLISYQNEFDATVFGARAIGARPMDEAVAINSMFRLNAYRAADMERLNKLGEVVKTKLRAGQSPSVPEMEQFMKQYASAGGNIQNYGAALQRWQRDANMSVVEKMKTFHNSSYAQRLTEIMAGTTIEDYYNSGNPSLTPKIPAE